MTMAAGVDDNIVNRVGVFQFGKFYKHFFYFFRQRLQPITGNIVGSNPGRDEVTSMPHLRFKVHYPFIPDIKTFI